MLQTMFTKTTRQKATLTAILASSLLLSGCADYTNQKALDNPDVEVDSAERFNRALFAVNNALDTVVVRPVTVAYRYVVPEGGRKSVINFVNNLSSPGVFANSVLQGDVQNSFATFWRFVINTTVGVGGLIDVASDAGLKNRPADFGQTLAKYGVGSGPYVYLPVFGPGTVRDSFGQFVDIFTNPSVYADSQWWSIAQTSVTLVARRDENFTTLEDIYRKSLDPYATIRSGWMQRRSSDLRKYFPTRPIQYPPFSKQGE
jgi:phospholipid-binding lipoprotein MlaA